MERIEVEVNETKEQKMERMAAYQEAVNQKKEEK